ncbi:MAG: AI-2E family transporter [Patescibacteria group bacterium]
MKESKLEIYIYFILLGITLFLTYKIFEPYLFSIIVALIFSVIFGPLNKRVQKSFPKHRSLSALVTLFIVFVLVLLPFILYGIQLSDEVKNFYDYAFASMQGGGGIMTKLTVVANNIITTFSPFGVHWPVFDVSETESYVFAGLSWIRGHFGDIFSGLAKFFVDIFIFLFAFYYFLRDGAIIRKRLIEVSPFPDNRDEEILEKLRLAILSVVKGSMLVALTQGIMTGLGFHFFGIPSALLWGGVTVIAALVPGVGTSLVIVPGILYLFFTGETTHAFGLLLWGTACVGLIDNVLGPKLIEKGINIHPLLILLSVLGGIAYFGVIGFILGPIVLSFLFTLFEIYKPIILKENHGHIK